jgi:hypothetical protein
LISQNWELEFHVHTNASQLTIGVILAQNPIVNKPQVYGRMTMWLLLFLEYDFKIVYKLGRSHLMVYALNRLPNQTKLVGVPN